MLCDIRMYRIHDGNLRNVVKCLEGTAHILYRERLGGSILSEELKADGSVWMSDDRIVDLRREWGKMWREEEDTFLGIYRSKEDADLAADAHLENG